MIVVGDRFAADADEGAAGIGSGRTGSVVEPLAMGTLSFAATEPGEVDLVGSAVRFVAFCTDDFFGTSVSADVLTTGRRAMAATGAAGAAVVGNGFATAAALSRSSGCCCERSVSFAGGRSGRATVAITSTAIPASTTICPRVGCHAGVGCITGAVGTGEVDSTAGRVAAMGAAAGTTVSVVDDVTESCPA